MILLDHLRTPLAKARSVQHERFIQRMQQLLDKGLRAVQAHPLLEDGAHFRHVGRSIAEREQRAVTLRDVELMLRNARRVTEQKVGRAVVMNAAHV